MKCLSPVALWCCSRFLFNSWLNVICSWWLCLMSKILTMEATAPVPAQQAHRVLRFLAVSWGPTQHQPFSPTKQQVKLRSPLQSSVQVSQCASYLNMFHLHFEGCQVFLLWCCWECDSLSVLTECWSKWRNGLNAGCMQANKPFFFNKLFISCF